MKRLLIPLFLITFILSVMIGCSFITEESKDTPDIDNNGETNGSPNVDNSDETNETPTEEPEHVHSYESVVTEPTEKSDGFTTHTCACGDSYIDTPVDKLPLSLRFDPIYSGSFITGYSVSAYSDKNYVDVVVPDTHEGKPVLSVKANGFSKQTSLKSVQLPEGITSIGSYAFGGCKNLKSINMPDSLATIEDLAFYMCTSLESVVFSEKSALTKIGDVAFAYCGNMKKLTVPSKLSNFGNGAIEGCNSLEYNEYDNALYLGDDSNPCVVLVKAKNVDITSCEIHKDTRIISNAAFGECTRLTEIVIPDGVLVIKMAAFCGSGLKSITVGKSVSAIEDFAFDQCYGLIEVVDHSLNLSFAPSKETEGGIARYALDVHDEESKMVNCDGYLFYTADGKSYLVGTTLTDSELVLPEDYNGENYAVYHYAFYLNDTLTSVEIGGGVSELGISAFEKCTALTSVILSDGLLVLGERAFFECTLLGTISVPETVKTVGGSAFAFCSSLKSVSLGNSLEKLSGGVFSNCTSLDSVVIPYGVTELSGMFTNCTSLTHVELPETITKIGYRCFENCTALTELAIPDGLVEIGDSAFAGCSKLGAIALHETLTSIGKGAFANCASIKSVVIPDSVLTLGEGAFLECTALTSAILGNGITVLKSSLFAHCKSLLEIVIPDSVTTVEKFVFIGCTALTSVELGNGITEISENMFNGCSSLLSVVIPESVTKIGTYAFSDCSSLVSIEFKCAAVFTGNTVLSGCASLQHVTLWEGLTTIEIYFFGECTSLVSVVLPKSLTTISRDAFYLCEGLESIYFAGTAEEWAGVEIKDKTEQLLAATVYFYSEAEPTEEGSYWHYGEDGEVVAW